MSSFLSPNQLGTDGVAYNPAQADLDMNGFSIINAGGGGGTVTNVFGTPGQINATTSGTDVTVSLAPTSVTAGSYTNANITVDGLGRVTAVTSGSSTSVADWANYPAIATINGGNQVMNSIRQVALSNPISQKALTVNFDNITYAPGSGNPSMIDVNIGAETGEILTTCPSSKPTLSYDSGTETLSLLGPTPSGTTVLSSVALPGSGVETLAQVLARGNSAGTNNISMNTTQKIINCADPTSAQDVATKNYVDNRPIETLAQTLFAGNSCGSSSIDMNGNSLLGANNITMPGVAPIITATNAIGTLSITALGGTNMATTGICNIASTGRLSLGSATYTSLENLRIDNSAVSKDSGADLTFDNTSAVRNVNSLVILDPSSTNPSVLLNANAPAGQVVIQNNAVPTCTFTTAGIQANKPLSFAGSLTGTLNASLNNIINVNQLQISNNNTNIGTIGFNNTYDSIETNKNLKPPSIVDKNNVTGTANQVLTSDGSGLIEWATVGGGGSQNLAQVLSVGNSAGSSAINMNNQFINNVGTVNIIDTTNPSGGVGSLFYRVAGNTLTTNCSLNIGTNQTQTGVFIVTPFLALRDVAGTPFNTGIQFNRTANEIQVGTATGASGINAVLSLPNNLKLNNNRLVGAQIQDSANSVGTNGQYLVANGSGSFTWTTPPTTPPLPNNIITFDTQTPVLSPSLAMGDFGSGNWGNFLVKNASQANPPSFIMPPLTNGCNRVVVSVSCPGAGFQSGPANCMGYIDLFDQTTGIATGGRFYSAGTPAYFPTTQAPGANWQQNLYMSDVFFAPIAGNTIQVRLWLLRWGNNLGSGITLYQNNCFCTVKVEPAIMAP